MSILMIVLWIMLAILISILIWVLYEINAPLLIIIQKELGLKLIRKRPKGDKFIIDGKAYVMDNKGAHPERGFFFWRTIFVYDEGSPSPRLLTYKKNEYIDGGSLKKLIDKDYINGVVTSMMGLLDSKKILLYLTIVVVLSAINVLVVAVILAKTLGLIGGTV